MVPIIPEDGWQTSGVQKWLAAQTLISRLGRKNTFQVGCPTANYDRYDLILCLDGSKKLVLCKPRLRGMVIMQAIFFDLDGTLTESGPGIIKAVQYALNKMGCPEADPQKLRFFIGPPLLDSMLRFRPFSQEEAEKAVELYHAYYCKEGIFDNRVYPGIRQMLKDLRASNVKLAVASSKPEILVRKFWTTLVYHSISTRWWGLVWTGSVVKKPPLSKRPYGGWD
jgi:Predicted phosphatases